VLKFFSDRGKGKKTTFSQNRVDVKFQKHYYVFSPYPSCVCVCMCQCCLCQCGKVSLVVYCVTQQNKVRIFFDFIICRRRRRFPIEKKHCHVAQFACVAAALSTFVFSPILSFRQCESILTENHRFCYAPYSCQMYASPEKKVVAGAFALPNGCVSTRGERVCRMCCHLPSAIFSCRE
jgi:hypothetical protein